MGPSADVLSSAWRETFCCMFTLGLLLFAEGAFCALALAPAVRMVLCRTSCPHYVNPGQPGVLHAGAAIKQGDEVNPATEPRTSGTTAQRHRLLLCALQGGRLLAWGHA